MFKLMGKEIDAILGGQMILIWTYASGLQIYGGPGSLSHDFKIWPITFQGSGPSGPILFSCEKKSLMKIFILQQLYELQKTESICRLSIQ